MNPWIGGQFGMKGASDAPILPHGDRFVPTHGEDLHLGSRLFEPGSSDENPLGFSGSGARFPLYRGDEGVNLSSIGIALHRDIDEGPALGILPLIPAHQYRPGTGTQQRQITVLDALENRRREVMKIEQMTQGGTLASRQHQVSHLLQLVRSSHFDGIATSGMESMKMRLH